MSTGSNYLAMCNKIARIGEYGNYHTPIRTNSINNDDESLGTVDFDPGWDNLESLSTKWDAGIWTGAFENPFIFMDWIDANYKEGGLEAWVKEAEYEERFEQKALDTLQDLANEYSWEIRCETNQMFDEDDKDFEPEYFKNEDEYEELSYSAQSLYDALSKDDWEPCVDNIRGYQYELDCFNEIHDSGITDIVDYDVIEEAEIELQDRIALKEYLEEVLPKWRFGESREMLDIPDEMRHYWNKILKKMEEEEKAKSDYEHWYIFERK